MRTLKDLPAVGATVSLQIRVGAGSMKRAWTAADILPSGGSLTLLGIATTTDGVVVEAEGSGVGALSELSPSIRGAS